MDGGVELRGLAAAQVDRRHTLIQLELAAAHFESRMVSGQTAANSPDSAADSSDSTPPNIDEDITHKFSTANAWDEYVTQEAQKRLHRRDPRGDICRVAQPCGHAHRRRRLAARRVCACVRAYACERVRVSVLRVCCVCVTV